MAILLYIKGQSVMNGINVVFDTCAIIKLLHRQYDLNALSINVEKTQFFTSVITRMELLSKRDLTNDEKQDIMNFLGDLTVVPLDENVEITAIEIRRATSMKLPDCIIAASSIALNATLLTNDDRLLNLSWPGLHTQNIL